ncbi:MAG: dihydrodipicolinate synthase family protein [Nitrososphaerota archaeon]|jgi:2-dehydro-3-deoxy-phosphogluconate/2-dehydro-3-deoxy-6-phosphogalactonate aldolase|nr:dihydrodipicolinate synthase family protein [Nitrososphaerota archaeon]MDG6959825.1 dihydrodipicolinate synthase family protein [Nitrososphaerota archaeon]MDG6961912.1 dihydrodipicolinate synthase family protein [Nitrososphaerota archaeon]MDG6987090.1 dihydrodipicolinate synthase family protein [Nitrososphaerota archaeon]MDG7015053.1 dihydrodipicolinate synthase family protein [Nitrososphaerota archaeon]
MKYKIVPLVTGFKGGKIDPLLLEGHAKRLLDSGVDYLFAMGSTGLGPALSFDERRLCLETLAKFQDRLICQVGSLNLDESVRLAELAKARGAKYISALPPYYFPRVPEDQMVRYFTKISAVHPTLLYNFPLTTGYDVSPSVVKAVNAGGGDIVGVKDTVADVPHMMAFKRELGSDFLVFSGPDAVILPALGSGIDGAVAGSGNYIPRIFAALLQEYQTEKGERLQRSVTSVAKLAQKYGQWSANYSLVRLVKGYDPGDPRPPIFPLSPEDEAKMGSELKEILPGGDSPA